MLKLISLILPALSSATPLPDVSALMIEQLVAEYRVEQTLGQIDNSDDSTCISNVCNHWETHGCDEFHKLTQVAKSCAGDNSKE